MEQHTLDFSDYFGVIKRRRGRILLLSTLVFLVGLAAALLWPSTYKSSATILIKEQDIPADLVRSTVTSFAAQRIQAISQRVMARPNLMEIIDKYNLYAEDREHKTTEEIIVEMRNSVGLDLIDAQVVDPRTGRPTAATIAFNLSFSGKNPEQVQKVANELMSLFLKENLKERSEKASEAYTFLSEESERLGKEIAQLESQIAEFKEQNVNELPELSQLNMQLMDRTERNLLDIDNQIRGLEERKVYLNGQLAQLKPFGADASLDPKTRLQALRTQYLALLARYSADHPDVGRMKREIEGLELETGGVNSSAAQMKELENLRTELALLREKYSADHPDVIKLERQIEALEQAPSSGTTASSSLASSAADNPDNPAYITLQSQVEAADGEIRSLKLKKAELQNKLNEYEERLIRAPQVEREYRTLSRDLQNATARYQEVKAKQMQAEIAQQLEKESKGERFVIVEPPILPEEPVSPNRPAIIFLSLVLALGIGFGYAAVAESLDDSIHGAKSIAMTVGNAPLAVIPYLRNDDEVRKRKRGVATRAAAAVIIVILGITALHVFWTPLDVLWYKALRIADVAVNT